MVWHWIQAAARMSCIHASAWKCIESHWVNQFSSFRIMWNYDLLHQQATTAASRSNNSNNMLQGSASS